MHIIENIYLLFDGLYSEALRDYLSGYDCSQANFGGANTYGVLGLQTLLISAVVALVYYKFLDPTRRKLLKWSLCLGTAAIIAFAWAYYIVDSAERKGLIGSCLLYDEHNNILIGTTDYIGLSIGNAIIAIVLYALISFGFKYWSTNNRYTPF